ncbi:hypothetical protein RGR602_PA00068 (plasmid) [Rhizobium gallicum bv. gallicum R602sp]|uniref:Uncharacterized protein n=1 Tax=Rhizobium gallicum bv. gallicum R602sp TaxID=1041138 RepID=A0A0B4X5N1_9HYPH|nr:hypothetical protein RGR602_PA00068 [Rhizobium gallicum bv. gallicum R602sp]
MSTEEMSRSIANRLGHPGFGVSIIIECPRRLLLRDHVVRSPPNESKQLAL